MSKSRLIVIAVVLILGGLWFFTPQSTSKQSDSSDAPQNQQQDEQQPAEKSETSANDKKSNRQVATGPAAAATPSEDIHAPGEAALRALQAESTRPWTARRTGMANGIKTLVHGLWTTGNGSDVRGSATAFVHDYAESLLGVPADQVRFSKSETTDRTKVVYDQYVNDTRVYGSTLTLFFEDGGLSRVQNDLVAKSTTLSAAPSDFTAAQAFSQFNSSEGSVYTLTSAKTDTVLYPGPTSLVYSYDFTVRNSETGKTYRVLYDAESQALIKKYPTQVQ